MVASLIALSNFTAALFVLHSQFLLENNNDVNFVISPVSAFVAVGMMNEGAAGTTQTEILNALQVQNMSALNSAAQQILSNPSDTKFNLISSNGVFVDNKFKILKSFNKTLTKKYQAKVENIEFGTAEGEKTVNDWVNKTTNGKIQKILEGTTPDDALALVNTIYMKGDWQKPFMEEWTEKGTFLNWFTRKTSEVDYMKVEDAFGYVDKNELGFEVAFFPYKTSLKPKLGWEMAIFNTAVKKIKLAYDESGKVLFHIDVVDQVLSHLNGNKLKELYSMKKTKQLNVKLPKFKIESETDLGNYFKQMGIKTAFENSANFSRISRKNLKVDSILQKSVIEVDERGTEAAAATSIQLTNMAAIQSKKFHVASSFGFAVFQPSTATVLFAGVVSNPSGKTD